MAGWAGRSEKLFDPLVAALGRYVLAGEKVHADDTPVAVLDPGGGHTKTGRQAVGPRARRPAGRPAGSIEVPAARYRYSPNRASSLELFQLSALIERLLTDPRRIIVVHTNMNLGQPLRFLDWHDGQMRNDKVVAMKDTQVTLHEEGTRREWKLPYAAVEPPLATGGPAPASVPHGATNDQSLSR